MSLALRTQSGGGLEILTSITAEARPLIVDASPVAMLSIAAFVAESRHTLALARRELAAEPDDTGAFSPCQALQIIIRPYCRHAHCCERGVARGKRGEQGEYESGRIGLVGST